MEVGPAQHYVMGGVEVDPDTAASSLPGLFAAGEVSGGMHGSNRLGGNSLSDLLVFGRRAGMGAVAYLGTLSEAGGRPAATDAALAEARAEAVSYTHLDVYKRQSPSTPSGTGYGLRSPGSTRSTCSSRGPRWAR